MRFELKGKYEVIFYYIILKLEKKKTNQKLNFRKRETKLTRNLKTNLNYMKQLIQCVYLELMYIFRQSQSFTDGIQDAWLASTLNNKNELSDSKES